MTFLNSEGVSKFADENSENKEKKMIKKLEKEVNEKVKINSDNSSKSNELENKKIISENDSLNKTYSKVEMKFDEIKVDQRISKIDEMQQYILWRNLRVSYH